MELARMRQWMFAAPFRIASPGEREWALAMRDLFASLPSKAIPLVDTSPPTAPPSPPVASALGEDFLRVVCNEYFRIHRNVTASKEQDGETGMTRKLDRALRELSDAFGRHDIQCLDLTGQPFTEGRTDFDPAAAGTPAAVDAPRISLCQRPAIYLGGRLIQRAKGLVEVPAQS